MNNFFKTFCASLLATITALGIVSVFSFIIMTAIVASMFTHKESIVVKQNSILTLDFSTPIVESISENPMQYLDLNTFEIQRYLTNYDMIKSIQIASTDPSIKAILLDLPYYISVDMAISSELRDALEEFRATGKKIYAYSDTYSQQTYLLGSIADQVYLCPTGNVDWRGMSSSTPFFKEALNKLGVNVEVFKYGKYKSAVEPYLLNKMSDESRQQTSVLLNDMWGNVLQSVSISRGIDSLSLSKYASDLAIVDAKEALKLRFVDKLIYRNEMEEILKTEYNTPNFITMANYSQSYSGSGLAAGAGSAKKQIAVIYADGEIMNGKSFAGIIGDQTLNKKIRKAANDNNVKAIILRVNSPGGSALASDIINKEMIEAKKKKPIIVSMGSYAASGGYYISCSADMIAASKYCVTGSIGVFGLAFDASEALKDKLGVSFDVVETNPNANLGGLTSTMTPAQRNFIQNGVNKVYVEFITAVAEGRDMEKERVDEIAQGRVWSAKRAQELGLVDKVEGLMGAINSAALLADIQDDFIVTDNYGSGDYFTTLMRILSGESVSILASKIFAPEGSVTQYLSKDLKYLETMMKNDRIQTIIPYRLNISNR